MRYTVELSGRAVEVEVEPLGADRWRIRLEGGEPREVQVESRAGRVHVVAGERSLALAVGRRGDGLHLQAAGTDLTARVLDERLRRLRARAGGDFAVEGVQVVRSPMPGKIVTVLVKVGEHVTGGRGLVVVEAMKMENELRATGPGVVTAIRVTAGDRVEAEAELVVIEAASPEPAA